jgi:cellulose synthase/poly-beta-1,6-N-acetylglucosamine synthase-like glycosyltransferase
MVVAAIFLGVFALTTLMTVVFVSRQLFMTLFILFTSRRSAYTELELSQWPTVTVVIPAHNEELVIDGGLKAMSNIDYPHDRITFLVLNDRSTDRTRELASAWQARDRRFKVYNRAFDAEPGKPAAIKEVISQLESEIMVFFDADYLPEPAIIKHLVAPYIDPEVGSTMGRVVPYNTNANMLTKLIDLERRGGYVVDQQARSLLNFLPQFGGTCGSVRLAALNEAGGWRKDVLAEDTDLTYRLFLHGWTVEYLNHAACYEESPEHWPIRMKQVRRWAYGHNECMFRYFFKVLGCKRQPLVRRLDASLVLLFYMFPVLSLVCLVMSLFYPLFFNYPPFNFSVVPAISFMIGFGNFSPYFQIMVGAYKDRQSASIVSLPFIFMSSTISMIASVSAFYMNIYHWIAGSQFRWDKTTRFRTS